MKIVKDWPKSKSGFDKIISFFNTILKTTALLTISAKIAIRANVNKSISGSRGKSLRSNLFKSQKLKNLINWFKSNRFYLKL